MKILAIGDVTSPKGVAHLEAKLWAFRKERGIDLCIVNAENAGFITGAGPELAERLLYAGADCLTGGNHTMQAYSAYSFLDSSRAMLRPINYGEDVPGNGYTVIDCMGYRMLIINAMGHALIEPTLDSPYGYIDRALKREEGKYDFSVMDIHAESTGEKMALAFNYDGRINVIFGTHTHIPTADEQILKGGTGYITDIGMCGESGGIMGLDSASVIRRMRTGMPYRFEAASGECVAEGVIFTLDTSSGRVTAAERIKF